MSSHSSFNAPCPPELIEEFDWLTEDAIKRASSLWDSFGFDYEGVTREEAIADYRRQREIQKVTGATELHDRFKVIADEAEAAWQQKCESGTLTEDDFATHEDDEGDFSEQERAVNDIWESTSNFGAKAAHDQCIAKSEADYQLLLKTGVAEDIARWASEGWASETDHPLDRLDEIEAAKQILLASTKFEELVGSKYEILAVVPVLYQGWECDEWGWLLKTPTGHVFVRTNHGSPYISSLAEADELIAFYEKALQATRRVRSHLI